MDAALPLSRREVLGAACGLAALAAAPSRALAQNVPGLWSIGRNIRLELRAEVMAALARHERRIWSRDVIGVVDYGQPSNVPRFHIVNLLAGTSRSFLVAHGKGSDPAFEGRLRMFSNMEGSEASSRGAYLIGEAYQGDHGLSRRLIGLDPTNDNAMDRAIVLHSAPYVGPDVLARQGKLGRSNGCFVVSPADIDAVLAALGRGRLLYAGA
ncbi:hypothetical protein G432_16755 [Sphingomonas sp. MM-1]|uniref:murein L,D-transpeptidase catalytic domain family protein n=1 Tax=Sphingomonas sp. MM-1 TaxID=745310 RepID=UPI0002C14802|nr:MULTISPECIES: murein L,D-transpeptidase catalytic domain family protein [unclassified Sphingomonas]AGH51069.1 hypothetical protein G432_16755 [Sphingomonas sp. MM-1]MDX3886048.1 murein L,D-transpeptidase catalytic domain family protein [Sphingomonas sp.]